MRRTRPAAYVAVLSRNAGKPAGRTRAQTRFATARAGYEHDMHHQPWLNRAVAYEWRFTAFLLAVLVLLELLVLVGAI